MALLTKTKRDKYLKDLGYDGYNKETTLKVQKKYFKDPKEWDSRWGKKTDILVRHLHNVWKYTKNFSPEEFRCTCGKCTGYPTWMKANALKHIQTIRTHYKKPIIVTSALRCPAHNAEVGGVKDSRHLEGRAVDIYIKGYTDTLEERKQVINYIKKLKNHRYSYCNGYNSIGQTGAVMYYPKMGNAIHTETWK